MGTQQSGAAAERSARGEPAARGGPAPGGPGLEPRWTTSAKSGVGTAYDGRSRVWFAVSHGIVDEVYYDRVDRANTRDLGLLVTDAGPSGSGEFFSEEKRHTRSAVHLLAPGVPGYRLVNTCADGRYRVVKTVVTDPERSVLVQHVRFEALAGALDAYRVFVLLAPHIGNQGYGNDGWVADYKGVPMLFAQRGETALALACAPGWHARSCGFVGVNDGWRQVSTRKRLVALYDEARTGNVALTGEVDLPACTGSKPAPAAAEFVVALAFGRTPADAGQAARLTLASRFANIERSYVAGWERFHREARAERRGPAPTPVRGVARDMAPDAERGGDGVGQLLRRVGRSRRGDPGTGNWELEGAVPSSQFPAPLPAGAGGLFRMSAAVIQTHEDKVAQGALIASLSIPWGDAKGDHEMGGYHLVWPRDLVESAGALLAAGYTARARRALRYLVSTQEADGHWAQNLWLDGTPYWPGVQMDETALPILLADMLRRAGQVDETDVWPMVRRAAAFLIRGGPVTAHDRWEEDGGYSPFTLAAEVAALLAAADFADAAGERAAAAYLRETADAWNEGIERWTYVTDTPLARRLGVDGYYARIAPPEVGDGGRRSQAFVAIKNRPPADSRARYDSLVSPDALALVRFGLRGPHDPRVVNTVRVIDALLRRETRTGPVWYRYNGDGYGEHEDGAPFDGTGIGRGWPLLAGERAHYELAAGRPDAARALLEVMRAQATDGGLIPEQVWDAADVPERELVNGRNTGSAVPLVWAHAEYVKLVRSLFDGRVFDTPPQPLERYAGGAHPAAVAIWSPHNRVREIPAGRALRVQTQAAAVVHWSADDWRTAADVASRDTGLGAWAADLDAAALPPDATLRFTLYWTAEERWEGRDYEVAILAEPPSRRAAEPPSRPLRRPDGAAVGTAEATP